MRNEDWFTRFLTVLCFLLWSGLVVGIPVSTYREPPESELSVLFMFILWTIIVAGGIKGIQNLLELHRSPSLLEVLDMAQRNEERRLFDPNLTRTVPTRVPLQHGASAVSPEGTRITVEAVDD